jgi:ribosomal protein S27AE
MRNETRLKKLEEKHGRECPECGFDGDWSKIRFSSHIPKPDEVRDNEYCSTCGRPTRICLRW